MSILIISFSCVCVCVCVCGCVQCDSEITRKKWIAALERLVHVRTVRLYVHYMFTTCTLHVYTTSTVLVSASSVLVSASSVQAAVAVGCTHLSVRFSANSVSICLSVCPTVYLIVCLSDCLSVCLSVCLSPGCKGSRDYA